MAEACGACVRPLQSTLQTFPAPPPPMPGLAYYKASRYGRCSLLSDTWSFWGLPLHSQLVKLDQHTAALADGAVELSPTVLRRLTGTSAASMAGTSGESGIGLLPLQQHVQACLGGMQLVTVPLWLEAPAMWPMPCLRLLCPLPKPCLLMGLVTAEVPPVLAAA